VTPAEAYTHCERLTRREARNFAYGIRLLEPERRAALSAIYALARRIDDIGDAARDDLTGPDSDAEPDGGAAAGVRARLAELDAVRHKLANLDDPGDDPVLVALGDARRRFPLPLGAFEELLEGCEMDCRGAAYATFDELVGYCQRVAGSVGRLSLAVFGRRAGSDPALLARQADDLGVALQLTNIVRDVREDQAMGRVYLPKEDLERFGVSPQLEGERGALVAVVLLLATRARSYYSSGLGLLPALDHRSAACAGAMAGIYRRLLTRIETRPEEVLERRVRLSSAEKALVAGRALILGRA
jgi:phytoene synthase